MNPEAVALILAAGKGKRMKSDLAKVLHRSEGRPLVRYIVKDGRAEVPRRPFP